MAEADYDEDGTTDMDVVHITTDANGTHTAVLNTLEHAEDYAERQGGPVASAMDVDADAASSSAKPPTGANDTGGADDVDI